MPTLTHLATSFPVSTADAAAASSSAGSTDQLTGVAGWAADVMTSLGAPGVGAVVALENLFPPIPSEVVLPLAGFLAGQGRLNLLAVIVWATAGSVIGALVLYGLGALLGRDRIGALTARVPLMSAGDIDRADTWFDRRGARAVFLGRMVPVVRSFVSIPAGVARMPLPRFLLLTAAGSLLWNTSFVVLGYALGSQWQQIGQYSTYINNTVLAALALALAVFVARRLRRRPAQG